jgi:hypothetical protein
MKPIKTFRKRKARKLREGKGVRVNPDGTVSTHLMSTYSGENKKGKHVYYAAPSIAPTGKDGKYEDQSFDQALGRGEVFQFRKERKADKFAHGSWKKKRNRQR